MKLNYYIFLNLYTKKTICPFVLINNFHNKLTAVLIGDNQTVFVNTVNADFMIDSWQTLCIFAIGVLNIGLSWFTNIFIFKLPPISQNWFFLSVLQTRMYNNKDILWIVLYDTNEFGWNEHSFCCCLSRIVSLLLHFNRYR